VMWSLMLFYLFMICFFLLFIFFIFFYIFFFFSDPATPDIYTLSLHDALPILFFLFWPDNLNEYRHSDRRHCEPTTARSGVAPGRAVPSDRESRRFSPGHHFRELSQMR